MFYHHHLLHQPNNTSSPFWGAFLGAFFAFVFGLVTYVITKRRERFVLHKNTLIKLDRSLNKHLNDLSVLKEILEDSMRVASENKVPSNRLFKLELPENIEMDLGSIRLVNKFFSYRLSTDQLNFNTATINHTLTRVEDLFINGQPVRTENFQFIRGTLEKFLVELPKFNEQTIELLLLTRVHQNKLKEANSFIQGVFKTQWEQTITQKEVSEERAILEQEIQFGTTDDS